MKEAARFLGNFAQALAAMSLYGGGHPSRARAIDLCYGSLRELQREVRRPSFSFLGDDVVFGQQPLQGLKDWPWGPRLGQAGVQRVDFLDTIDREELEQFLTDLLTRLGQTPAEAAAWKPPVYQSIRYGTIGLKSTETATDESLAIPALPFSLDEETQTIQWVQEEVTREDRVPVSEAEAVVRSLSVAMRGDQLLILPLLRLRAAAEYKAIHAINVAVLAMAVAGEMGMADRDVHNFGLAGLLYDLGMARLPRDLMRNEGALTEEERRLVQRHPVEGARMILRSDRHLDLAAAVAYEHHIRPDGTGYPAVRDPRDVHFASRVIRVCDVYDALRTDRPYRPAWDSETALYYIELYGGTEFDAEIARTFAMLMRRIEAQLAGSASHAS